MMAWMGGNRLLMTGDGAEGSFVLRAHKALQGGSVVKQPSEPHPGLLWREDWIREGLQAMVEGPAGVQLEEGQEHDLT